MKPFQLISLLTPVKSHRTIKSTKISYYTENVCWCINVLDYVPLIKRCFISFKCLNRSVPEKCGLRMYTISTISFCLQNPGLRAWAVGVGEAWQAKLLIFFPRFSMFGLFRGPVSNACGQICLQICGTTRPTGRHTTDLKRAVSMRVNAWCISGL